MIHIHTLPWDKCLSHQVMPAIQKGWKDEGKDVHFFWGLAGQNIRQIRKEKQREPNNERSGRTTRWRTRWMRWKRPTR